MMNKKKSYSIKSSFIGLLLTTLMPLTYGFHGLHEEEFSLKIPVSTLNYFEQAEQGNDESMRILGSLYYYGKEGVNKNSQRALQWYERSAVLGNSKAMKRLGDIYRSGTEEIEQNYSKALYWYKKILDKGNKDILIDIAHTYSSYNNSTEDNKAKAKEYYGKAKIWYEEEAEDGNDNAMLALGTMYNYGYGVQTNLDKAIKYYDMAIDKGNNVAKNHVRTIVNNLTNAGVKHHDNKEYEQAMSFYYHIMILPRYGDYSRANARQGAIIESGVLTRIDRKYAHQLYMELVRNKLKNMIRDAERSHDKKYLQRAIGEKEYYENKALKDTAHAKLCLGDLYFYGKGGRRDYKEAKFWYQEASDDNTTALTRIGDIYLEGYGLKINYEKAKKYYEDAMRRGDNTAIYKLGELYFYGKGVDKDYDKAIVYYKEATRKGNIDAIKKLAQIYEYGYGGYQSYVEAKKYYEKIAVMGDDEALTRLGIFYREGYGVYQDYTKAKEYFEYAATKGNKTALNDLGVLYFYGYGVDQNYKKAQSYWEEAVKQGSDEAQCSLGTLYVLGDIEGGQDYIKAREHYTYAAEKGNITAMYNLGVLFTYGYGARQSYEDAFDWYKGAVRNGYDLKSLRQIGILYEQGGYGIEQNETKAVNWKKALHQAQGGDFSYALQLIQDEE